MSAPFHLTVRVHIIAYTKTSSIIPTLKSLPNSCPPLGNSVHIFTFMNRFKNQMNMFESKRFKSGVLICMNIFGG